MVKEGRRRSAPFTIILRLRRRRCRERKALASAALALDVGSRKKAPAKLDQATATLQDRIDCLDRKLTAKQLEELKSLVRLLGFELKPTKPKLSIWAKRRIARSYKGIPHDQVKGVTWYYRGPLCPSSHPADIAAFYANVAV